jgi:hypothetical protein
MTCEHAEELREAWKDFNDYPVSWCGNLDPHIPHDFCLGIMCDYGCYAEYF